MALHPRQSDHWAAFQHRNDAAAPGRYSAGAFHRQSRAVCSSPADSVSRAPYGTDLGTFATGGPRATHCYKRPLVAWPPDAPTSVCIS